MIETQFCRGCMKTQQVIREVMKYGDQTEETWKCMVCGTIVRTSRMRDLFKKFGGKANKEIGV